MSSLFQLIINTFILLLLAAVVEQFLCDSKLSAYVKPAVSAAVIVSVISFASKLDIKSEGLFDIGSYAVDTETVWQTARENSETVLESHMLETCRENGLNIASVDVTVDTDMSAFEIENICIYGVDKMAAKGLIAGYYGVDSKNIDISGDG